MNDFCYFCHPNLFFIWRSYAFQFKQLVTLLIWQGTRFEIQFFFMKLTSCTLSIKTPLTLLKGPLSIPLLKCHNGRCSPILHLFTEKVMTFIEVAPTCGATLSIMYLKGHPWQRTTHCEKEPTNKLHLKGMKINWAGEEKAIVFCVCRCNTLNSW